jgi:hypothetical protein
MKQPIWNVRLPEISQDTVGNRISQRVFSGYITVEEKVNLRQKCQGESTVSSLVCEKVTQWKQLFGILIWLKAGLERPILTELLHFWSLDTIFLKCSALKLRQGMAWIFITTWGGHQLWQNLVPLSYWSRRSITFHTEKFIWEILTEMCFHLLYNGTVR